jgi:hypothetical protein
MRSLLFSDCPTFISRPPPPPGKGSTNGSPEIIRQCDAARPAWISLSRCCPRQLRGGPRYCARLRYPELNRCPVPHVVSKGLRWRRQRMWAITDARINSRFKFAHGESQSILTRGAARGTLPRPQYQPNAKGPQAVLKARPYPLLFPVSHRSPTHSFPTPNTLLPQCISPRHSPSPCWA